LIQSYDDKGNLIESRDFSTHGETVYTYQYDEQNRVMSKSSNGTLIETYTYEPDGSYKIQSVNNADEYSVYRADGKIELHQSGPNTKSVFIYNDEGFLVECINYYKEIMNKKTVYYLDENGNAIKISQVNSQGIETVMGEYEYKLYTVKTK
jgi:YD repeat-containing protein